MYKHKGHTCLQREPDSGGCREPHSVVSQEHKIPCGDKQTISSHRDDDGSMIGGMLKLGRGHAAQTGEDEESMGFRDDV